MRSEKNPDGWKIVSRKPDHVIVERNAKIHFLEKDMLNYLIKKYNKNLFEEYIDNNNFKSIYNNLSIITIENPSLRDRNLYSELINILKPLIEPILYA
jgi:hypothetical protein